LGGSKETNDFDTEKDIGQETNKEKEKDAKGRLDTVDKETGE
jgi:hypothetical protein